MDDLGTFSEAADGTVTLRYVRLHPRPVQTVWAALTTPERLADSLGAAEVEPRLGGRFNLFVDREDRTTGRITVWAPPRRLEFTWANHGEPETTIACELTPDGEGEGATRLVFTHRGMARRWIGLVLPGWHVHLERLGEALVTGAATNPDTSARWRALQGLYVERYALTDVMIDPPRPLETYR